MLQIKDKMLSSSNIIMREVYIIDIDSYMVTADAIMSNYVNLPAGCIYIKGLRFPLASRKDLARYTKYGISGDSPWHPFLTIPMLHSLVEYYQYTHTDNPELFEKNPVCDGCKVYDTLAHETDESIILSIIPDITSEDMDLLIELFLVMYHNVFENIFEMHPNDIFSLDTSTSTYNLVRYDDIRAYRFTEVMDINGG